MNSNEKPSDEELEHIRLDILTTPVIEYPKVVNYHAHYTNHGHLLGDQVLLEEVTIEYANGRTEVSLVSRMKGHFDTCSRKASLPAGFPVLFHDSCQCHDHEAKKKSRGRWSKD